MSSLLAIETATSVCSVAYLADGSIVMESTLQHPRSHAERLVPMIGDVLETCRVETVDVVAVSSGPGSYTGLRIGVSTAKGIAMAHKAALVAVPTLEVLAATSVPFAEQDDVIASVLRARRGEWYIAAYRPTVEQNGLTPLEEASIVSDADLPKWFARLDLDRPSTLWLASDQMNIVSSLPIDASISPRLLPSTVARLSARQVATLGWLRFRAGKTEDLASFEPFYLRPYRARKATPEMYKKLP